MNRFLIILVLAVFWMGCTTNRQYVEGIPMGKIQADKTIDMRGKIITPFILFNTVAELKKMEEGEILEINTDNFEAIENDVNAWSRMTGHRLIEMETGEHYQRYYIEKTSTKNQGKKFAMIISDPGLGELISPLGMALSAALSGMDVHLYFQGPGVKVLKKGYNATLKGFQKPFSYFAREGLAKGGHLPPQDKLRQLKDLGAHIYICGGSMEPFGVKKSNLMFDDIIIAEYMTFLEVMGQSDLNIMLQ